MKVLILNRDVKVIEETKKLLDAPEMEFFTLNDLELENDFYNHTSSELNVNVVNQLNFYSNLLRTTEAEDFVLIAESTGLYLDHYPNLFKGHTAFHNLNLSKEYIDLLNATTSENKTAKIVTCIGVTSIGMEFISITESYISGKMKEDMNGITNFYDGFEAEENQTAREKCFKNLGIIK